MCFLRNKKCLRQARVLGGEVVLWGERLDPATALAVAGHFAPQDNARPDTPDSPLAKGGDNTDFAALALAN